MIPKYPRNHGKFWTHTDIAVLTKLANRGYTVEELAEFFGRTKYSIHCKAETIGIKIYGEINTTLVINGTNYDKELDIAKALFSRRLNAYIKVITDKMSEEQIIRRRNGLTKT